MHTTTSIVTTGVLIGPFGPLAKKIIMLAVDMTINGFVFIIVPTSKALLPSQSSPYMFLSPF